MPRILVRLVALAAATVAVAASGEPADGELARTLERFDRVQSSIQTLSAEFTETRQSPLLKEPIIARGRFFLTKPNSVLWEYTAPEAMRFVVANDEYVGVFPSRKRAERRDIHRFSEQLFRFFGLGQGSSELRKFYEIRMGERSAKDTGTVVLVLTPKKRRVKKALDEVRLWVDSERMVPRKLCYMGKDGSAREIVFDDARINPQLAASLYDVQIPAGFSVTSGFSGFELGAQPR